MIKLCNVHFYLKKGRILTANLKCLLFFECNSVVKCGSLGEGNFISSSNKSNRPVPFFSNKSMNMGI